jgi:hypothetical protein
MRRLIIALLLVPLVVPAFAAGTPGKSAKNGPPYPNAATISAPGATSAPA